jgi:hypothetical protein
MAMSTVTLVAMATPVTLAPISVLMAALLISLVIFPSAALLIALAFVICIVALVFRFVFLRSHEVYGPIAGVVFAAVLAPISCVTGRNVQVHGRRRSIHWFDQHRLCIDDRRRTIVTDLHLAVHARRHLARQHDADVQVARVSAADAGEHDRNECDYTHMKNPLERNWQERPCAQIKSRNQLDALSAAAKVCTIN